VTLFDPEAFGEILQNPREGWLRGVDLNHRPLGYEFNGKLIRNNLHAHG
jgi:hypothetical protein